MTIEEKAKAYDELLAKAKQIYNKENDVLIMHTIEDLFPELKESEDERIRKTIIRFFKDNYPNETGMYDGSVTVGKAIVWLEKQGEQETNEWKEGNIIRHGGILALVIKGRRVMKSNGEIFTVQYPDEWVEAAPNEIEYFLNEFEKQGGQEPADKAEPFDKYEGLTD